MLFTRWKRSAPSPAPVRPARPAVVEPLEGGTLLSAVTFTLDAARSTAALSGSGFASVSVQGKGGLSTHYHGTISADVSGGAVHFLGHSSIAASNNGTWRPGDKPGDYGAVAAGFVDVALRSLVLDVTSGRLALGSGGSFSSSGEKFLIKSGRVDYAASGFFSYSGSENLAGRSSGNQAAAKGTLVVHNHVATLTIPLSAKVTVGAGTAYASTFTVSGKLVATARV